VTAWGAVPALSPDGGIHNIVNFKVVCECSPYRHGLVKGVHKLLPRLLTPRDAARSRITHFRIEISLSLVEGWSSWLNRILEGQCSLVSLVNKVVGSCNVIMTVSLKALN
jgi:hypothetical protein